MEIKLKDYHKRVNAEMRVSVIFKVFRNLQVERTTKDNNGNVQPSSVNRFWTSKNCSLKRVLPHRVMTL